MITNLRLSNMFIAIQPPRNYNKNPIAIYHNPNLAPTHHYLTTYHWLNQSFNTNAIIHLNKHKTLEWLPKKALRLSATYAPNTYLGNIPLFYPFIINNPNKRIQTKRHTHTVVIDHLIPPMMHTKTYNELTQLKQLLNNYTHTEALNPNKLPILTNHI